MKIILRYEKCRLSISRHEIKEYKRNLQLQRKTYAMHLYRRVLTILRYEWRLYTGRVLCYNT